MRHKFRVMMKISGEYILTDDQKSKQVDKWMEVYENTPQAEEISIFQREDDTFKLIHSEHRRRIGF